MLKELLALLGSDIRAPDVELFISGLECSDAEVPGWLVWRWYDGMCLREWRNLDIPDGLKMVTQ
jgi:hypothetical protein